MQMVGILLDKNCCFSKDQKFWQLWPIDWKSLDRKIWSSDLPWVTQLKVSKMVKSNFRTDSSHFQSCLGVRWEPGKRIKSSGFLIETSSCFFTSSEALLPLMTRLKFLLFTRSKDLIFWRTVGRKIESLWKA